MKRVLAILFISLIGISIFGCGGPGSSETSPYTTTINITINLAQLFAGASPTPTVTQVAFLATCPGYNPFSDTFQISGTTATLTVYCNAYSTTQDLQISVYTSNNPFAAIYIGTDASVNIPSGNATINLSNTNFSWTTGYNSNNYFQINQNITSMLFDPVNNIVYLYDAPNQKLGVYTADTMALTRTVPIKNPITAITLSSDKSAALVGTSAGFLFSMNLTSGAFTQINSTAAGMPVNLIAPLDPNDIFIGGYTSASAGNVETINSGTIDTTNKQTFSCGANPNLNLVYSAYDNSVYLSNNYSGISCYRLNNYTISGSHSSTIDENLIRLFDGGEYLVTGNGSWFQCNANNSTDLTSLGSLPYPFVDLAADDSLSKIYLLYSNNSYSNPSAALYVLEQTNLLEDYSCNLLGTPLFVAYSTDNVFVFYDYTNRSNVTSYYAQIIPKTNFSANLRGRQAFSRKRP